MRHLQNVRLHTAITPRNLCNGYEQHRYNGIVVPVIFVVAMIRVDVPMTRLHVVTIVVAVQVQEQYGASTCCLASDEQRNTNKKATLPREHSLKFFRPMATNALVKRFAKQCQ